MSVYRVTSTHQSRIPSRSFLKILLEKILLCLHFHKVGFLSRLDQSNKLCHQRGILHILMVERKTESIWIPAGEPVVDVHKRAGGSLKKFMEEKKAEGKHFV